MALLYDSDFPFSLHILPALTISPPYNFSNWLFREFQLDTILPKDSC